MFGNIWADIQNYFKDWLARTGGVGAYTTFEVDLSVAHTEQKYDFSGDQIIITNCDNPVTIKLNDRRNEEIDLDVIKQINSPYTEFYITNTATSGSLKILCGTEGVFQCDPSIRIMTGKYGNQFMPVAVDTSGNIISVMKGLEGANLRTVAVDADGNIIGVFKGEYSGALKTLATDSEGRLLAIITDPEDVYGNAHQLGNAELAARLGSLNSYDRRGNVVFSDSFQDNINTWKQTPVGTGSAIALSTDRIYKGVSSAKLTAGSDGNHEAYIERYFPLSTSTKLGFELLFSLGLNVNYVTMHITIYDGTWKHQCMMRLDVDNEKLQYRIPGDPGDVSGGGYGIYEDYHLFYKMKMVIDTSTIKYVRMMFNEKEYDMSAIALRSDSSGNDPYIHVKIENEGDNGSNGVLYLGGFILTQNEP